jgi:TetR/AcrR family transcriptional repressor of uid operon
MTVAVQHETGTRPRVVQAARHLFSTRGFHRTAMADLAETAGVSVGAIYRLFKGKADIIQAIVEEDARLQLHQFAVLVDQVKSGTKPVEAALTEVMMLCLSESAEDEALSFEILAEAHRNESVARTIADLCRAFREMFRGLACAVNPQLPSPDLDAAEELLLACTFGLGHRTLSAPRLGIVETAEHAAKMICHALNPATACSH